MRRLPRSHCKKPRRQRCGLGILPMIHGRGARATFAVIAWHFVEVPAASAAGAAEDAACQSHDDQIHATRFSPDGRLAITASKAGTARVFAVGLLPAGLVFRMGGDAVNVAVVSPDGSQVAIGSRALLKIFDLATGAVLIPNLHVVQIVLPVEN